MRHASQAVLIFVMLQIILLPFQQQRITSTLLKQDFITGFLQYLLAKF